MEALLSCAELPDGGKVLSEYVDSNDISVDITGGPHDNTALLQAAANNNVTAVTNLVLEGADMCATNADGDTPLILAARLGSKNVVNVLLENGCVSSTILNKKNFYGRSALFEACTVGHMPVVKILMESLADPISSDNFQNTCLIQSCRIGSTDIVHALLHLGVNPSGVNELGETALMIACSEGFRDIVKMLIEYRASTSVKDKNGNTPLIVAARHGHRDLVSSLIKRNTNFGESNKFGETALLAACAGGHLEIVRLLLSKSRKYEIADREGNAPLHIAAKNGHIDLVNYLLTHKEPVSSKNRDGNTALHLAAISGDCDSINCLLTHGSGVSAKNNGGATPLLLAARHGHLDAIKVLIAGRANVASRSSGGNTAFLEAAHSGHLEVISYLADRETDVFAKNSAGLNAIHCAVIKDQSPAIEPLVKMGIEISAVTLDGDTPLLLACRLGYLKVTTELISRGADPHIRDKDGNSLLLVAASHGHADLIELLFKLNLANILDENNTGNDALIEAALNEKTSAAIVLLKHGADLSVVNKEGRSAYQYCATIPGFLSQWWLECAEPIVVTGAVGPCATEVNGLYDPVSINASESSFLPMTASSLNLGDDTMSQYQYVKRPAVADFGSSGFNNQVVLTKMKLTPSGIVIKRSSHHEKKSKVFARLNYRGGLPEHNDRKRWEISRQKGFLWTKFDKQNSVRVWSKSQILAILMDDSVEETLVLERVASMKLRLGNLVGLLDLPIELRTWSNIEILRYMHDGLDVLRMRVILVGPKRSGKSLLFKKLVDNNSGVSKCPSDGVVTGSWSYGDICFSLWDLGGDKGFQTAESVFFNSQSLFLVVWNPKDGDPLELQEHIDEVRNCAPLSPIVIVSTHADARALPLEDYTLQELNAKYGSIWSYVHVGLRNNEGLVTLKDEIARVASELPYVHQKIPQKFVLLQEELDRMSAEEEVFSIPRKEFYRIAVETVAMTDASANRALELFRAWGKVYVLSKGSLVLQPHRLVAALGAVFSQSTGNSLEASALPFGILYHTEDSLDNVWKPFKAELYDEFIDLLYENDLAYLIRGRNGQPFDGLGVSIIPELLTCGASDKHELAMRSSVFPEGSDQLPTMRLKYSFIPGSYFAKLQCRCGFMTMIGSSWKYGFAVELVTEIENAATGGMDLKSSFALVCLQQRHQTITIHSCGASSSACSAVLHAMISLRDSSFPFMELDEVDVIDHNNDRSGVEQKLNFSADEFDNHADGDFATAYELSSLRGKSDLGLDRGDSFGGMSDRHDSMFVTANTTGTDDSTRLGLFAKQGHPDSEVSLVSSPGSVRTDDTRLDTYIDDDLDIMGSNSMTIEGDDVYVSDSLKELFDYIYILRCSDGTVSNIVSIDILLAKCVREIMSYCVRQPLSKPGSTKALWIAFRTDQKGGFNGVSSHVTLFPLSPGPRVGHKWCLLNESGVTIPLSLVKESTTGILKGMSNTLYQALIHILDKNSLATLQCGGWIGLVDLTSVLPQVHRVEVGLFESAIRPPCRSSIYVSVECAQKIRNFPHTAAYRLLDTIESPFVGDSIADFSATSDILDSEAMYKLLHDFINKQQQNSPEESMNLKSIDVELSSFDVAQQQSLTASSTLMTRLTAGFDKLRVVQARDMQHRQFPTTFVIIDKSLVKPSFLSLTSTKSYARQSAVRRLKDVFDVLREPASVMKSRFDGLLANSMIMYLLCECCLQPQECSKSRSKHGQGGVMTRQPSGLVRQGSTMSRQGSMSLQRQVSDFSRQSSGLQRQGSMVLNRQSSHSVCAETSIWPVKIKSPKDRVVPFLPLTMISFQAAVAVNGRSHLGRLFGMSTPVIPEDVKPVVSEFVDSLGDKLLTKEFEAMQEKLRGSTSRDGPAISNYCVEQFGRFLMREDPESEWMNFLSRRVAENGDVVFVCNQCIAAFNN